MFNKKEGENACSHGSKATTRMADVLDVCRLCHSRSGADVKRKHSADTHRHAAGVGW